MVNNKLKIQYKLGVVILSLLVTSLFPLTINAQQPGSQVNSGVQSKQAGNALMIPRVTKPWSQALRWVGNGSTLYSDFAVIKDKINQWHCIGTFGIGPDGIGNGNAAIDGYSLFHAAGSSIDKALTIQPKIHYQISTPQPATMWAPAVIWNKDSTTAYLYYFHYYGQDRRNEVCARMLTSNDPDLATWRPYEGGDLPEQNMIFREIDERDFRVFWDERVGKYLMYYCGQASGPRVRTSSDLIHWSEPVNVLDGSSGGAHGYAESPYVFYRNGYYYLWTSGIDYSHTHLYISEDPFNFGDAILNSIEETPGHAPELAFENGIDYMACSMVSTHPSTSPAEHDLDGILIQPLKWEAADTNIQKRVTRLKKVEFPPVPASIVWDFDSDAQGWHDLGAGRDVKGTWENGSFKMSFIDGTPDPAQGPQLWFPGVQVEKEFDANTYRYLEITYGPLNIPTTAPVKVFLILTNSNNESLYVLADLDPNKNFLSIDLTTGWGKPYSGMMKALQIEFPFGGDPAATPAANWFGSSIMLNKVALINTPSIVPSAKQVWNFDSDNEGWLPFSADADIDLYYGVGNLNVAYSDHGAANTALNSPKIVKNNLAIDAAKVQKLKMNFTANWPATGVSVPVLFSYTVDAGVGYSLFTINPAAGTFTQDIVKNDSTWGVPLTGTISKIEIELPYSSEPSAAIATNWFNGSTIKIDKIELIDPKTAPVLSYVSRGPITIGDKISATSNEDAGIYLVPLGTAKVKADIIAAAVANTSATADVAATLNTTGLALGNYIVYAIDADDNVSDASASITISAPDITAPVLTDVTAGPVPAGNTISAKSDENANVFLVPEGTAKVKADIFTAAVANAAATANVAVTLKTTGIAAGNYIVYAIDAAGNVSDASASITIKLKDPVWDFATDMEGWHDLGAGRDVTASWDNGFLKMTYFDGAPAQGPQLWFAAIQVEQEFDAGTHRYLEMTYTPVNWPATAPIKFLISLLNSNGEPVYSYAELDPKKNFVSVDVAAFDPGWGKKYTGTMKQLQLELPHNGAAASNPATSWFGASTLIDKIEMTNSLVTGTKNLINEPVSIYPNPATKSFNVTGTDADKISIYNSVGLLIKKVSKTNKNISVEGFAKGLYFVKIEYKGVSSMKKLIVE
jgi:hypothetical protein